MPKTTPIYRLPYVLPDEGLTEVVDRTRFMAIDRQLESIFTFMGDGVINGWELSKDTENQGNLVISPGTGVVSSIAISTSAEVILESDDLTSSSDNGQALRNNIYLKIQGDSPYTSNGEFLATTQTFDYDTYLPLGFITVDSSGAISSIDTSSDSGRKELELIRYIAGLVSQHVHTGVPGEPEKIDLFNHVKGVLSSTNLEDIPASKITSGIIPKDRFNLSHSDLSDIGTITHEELDSLIENLQNLNKILFGDLMTSNLIQLIISLKHTFGSIDDYMTNFAAVIPGISNSTLLGENTFIDINSTDAELDYLNHRIRGKYVEAKELGQYVINSVDEFEQGDYDSNYISIESFSMAYGYGYGYGQGIDYFDVIMTNLESSFDASSSYFDFDGSETGYGTSDISQLYDFETYNTGSYAYGYGWEYATGFPNTLSSTYVTLNQLGADIVIHDKNSGDEYVKTSIGLSSSGSVFDDIEESDSLPPKKDIIIYAADKAGRAKYKYNGVYKRSEDINSVQGATTDLFDFTSFRKIIVGGGITLDSDKSVAFSCWDEPYDASDNSYLTFLLSQTESGAVDTDWTFDHSMDLYIEVTMQNEGTYGKRYYYRYTNNSGSSYRFIDKTQKYFSSYTIQNNLATTEISANLSTLSNIEFFTGYEIVNESDDTTEFEYTTAANPSPQNSPTYITSSSLTLSEILSNISGFYLLATKDEGYDYDKEAYPIYFPQGGGYGNPNSDGLTSSITQKDMLADINKVYFTGDIRYSNNPSNNTIEGLEINFPDPVNFESISWVSSEPSDSAIYLQIKRNAAPSGVETGGNTSGDSSYQTTPIYTNSSDSFTGSGAYASLSLFSASPELLSSGSAFPSRYENSYGVTLKVTLLPSSDNRLTPSLSSITINYSTNTERGQVLITSSSQWQNAFSTDNALLTNGSVKILDTERTSNVYYGTYQKLVEYEVTGSSWPVVSGKSPYTGEDLPKTSLQILNNQSTGLSGYITDVKMLENGDAVILDRDSSRIIKVDSDFNCKEIICSEYSYDKNYLNNPYIPASSLGKITKVDYNREIGDNGVLYVVFSHDLDAWYNGVITSSESEESINVRPSAYTISSKGVTYDLSGLTIYACDRSILCFVLSAEISNWIESLSSPKLQMSFNPQSNGDDGYVTGDTSCIKFNDTNILISSDSTITKTINKYGNKGTYTGNKSVIYMPIQGSVAFDIDSDGYYYLLKSSRPYIWDTSSEKWYLKFDPNSLWTGYDSIEETSDDFPSGSLPNNNSDPDFFLNYVFGSKGSIQKYDDYLMICISGFGKDGLLIFRKSETDTSYSLPTIFNLPDDGTYPMDARFDTSTFTTSTIFDGNEFTYIYVALSDLNTSSSSVGLSRVVKFDANGTEVWNWGNVDSENAVTVNSVRFLQYLSGLEGVVIST